ncbi:MAG: aminoacyl-histidine dipeptidase [Deltaproteobacteria bacterium]|nr:aminoacyl-histidine dipeptidase [Deltaproteobacteria bacterium]
MDIANLEPKFLWQHFAALCRIPRGSKNEAAVVAHVEAEAKKRGLEVRRDSVGDLAIRIKATPGRESAPPLVIQGHLDMVCEKNADTKHDFERDPIRAVADGEWVHATGTTLGADNGIGVAAGLALMDDRSVVHPPLELLLTIDEESGMTGALSMPADFFAGRRLLNLDSEEDGTLYVGCAGGGNSELKLALRRDASLKGFKAFTARVTGLRGGHSGLNINENRANAIKLLVRVLRDAAARMSLRLGSIEGGNKHNAIPREATATVYVPTRKDADFRKLVQGWGKVLREEFAGIEPELKVELAAPPAARPKPITAAAAGRALDLLCALPHGVLGMSQAIPGLVETSNNLAVVATEDRALRIVTSSRSSVGPTLQALLGQVAATARLAGADVAQGGGYPAWKPNMDSHLLKVARETYKKMYGAEAKVTAIHAGLETGIIGSRVPGIDMLSFGPQIEGAHSPTERVHVASVAKFYEFLKGVLLALA